MADAETQAAATALLDLCKAKKLWIATAESCTGGLVAARLTDRAGSSAQDAIEVADELAGRIAPVPVSGSASG